MNSIVFGIDGYDTDSREIPMIPEVRLFYRAFHEAWPYWIYFCNLGEDGLTAMVTCCMNSFAALQVDGKPTVGVEHDPVELLHFLGRDFPLMNLMWDRGEMFERLIYARSKAVFEYFGLPFDSPPPP